MTMINAVDTQAMVEKKDHLLALPSLAELLLELFSVW